MLPRISSDVDTTKPKTARVHRGNNDEIPNRVLPRHDPPSDKRGPIETAAVRLPGYGRIHGEAAGSFGGGIEDGRGRERGADHSGI
mmetsp:Transcript_39763/g.46488  ORF Transcript_39763/g.46488 Transcript_39763/m.46488 type:complete len:86 (-) Transcript_39763:190-447(-)